MAENKITLSRSLSTKDLVVYGIIFMIPVAPIAFYGSFLSPAQYGGASLSNRNDCYVIYWI